MIADDNIGNESGRNDAMAWPQTASLADREFTRFQALVHEEAGIYLSAAKHPLVVSRLAKRLRALRLASFSDYYQVVQSDPAEKIRMLDCICTNETHFFRERRHYDFLESHVLPAWKHEASVGTRPKRIHVWSAGCSTGEEPYSLAMFFLHHLGSDWTIDILATDLSTKVLAKAENGLWPVSKAAEIPVPFLGAYMLRGVDQNKGLMKASSELRSHIRFSRLNLSGDLHSVRGPFDLIFCCNVMIYFNSDTKKKLVARLISKLSRTGYFMVGHAESLNGMSSELFTLAPTIYSFSEQLRTRDRLQSQSGSAVGTASV
jgi:chemotaxis protein methyltransferase CheR